MIMMTLNRDNRLFKIEKKKEEYRKLRKRLSKSKFPQLVKTYFSRKKILKTGRQAELLELGRKALNIGTLNMFCLGMT